MKFVFKSILPAFLLATGMLNAAAAQLELLGNNIVNLSLPGSASHRVAIDLSRNLKDWAALTTVSASNGSASFVNDASQADPMRFFRIADGDETFAIAGYVDGGPSLGGVAGVTVTENFSGTSVTTDANGFFHFNQRFTRTNLPIMINASADGLLAVFRVISTVDSSSLCVLSMPYKGVLSTSGVVPDPILHTNVNRTIEFSVTGGSRAGMHFAGHFNNGSVSIIGDVSGGGPFTETDAPVFSPYLVSMFFATNVTNQMYLFPVQSSPSGGWGYFSGIPGVNGTLAGNGMMTWTNEYPVVVAPTNLTGRAFALGTNAIQFTNNVYTITRDGTNYTGIFYGPRDWNTWNLTLTTGSPTEATASLQLNFTDATDGTYVLQWPGEQAISGAMHQTEYVPPIIGGVPAPAALSRIEVTTDTSGIGLGVHYSVNFSGGVSGTFVATSYTGELFGTGTYTYTVLGSEAHLFMSYPEFQGDFDDMTLKFTTPPGGGENQFTGTQKVGGTFYPFTGTFTY